MSAKIPTFDQVVNECYRPDDGRMNHPLLIERLEEREGFVLDALEKEKGEPTEIWAYIQTPVHGWPYRPTNGVVFISEEEARMLAETDINVIYFFCHGLT